VQKHAQLIRSPSNFPLQSTRPGSHRKDKFIGHVCIPYHLDTSPLLTVFPKARVRRHLKLLTCEFTRDKGLERWSLLAGLEPLVLDKLV